MLKRLFSNDPPRPPALAGLLLAIALALAVAPLLLPAGQALDAAAQMLVLTLLGASLHLLWRGQRLPGCAPGLWFGLGALGVAWTAAGGLPPWSALVLGGGVASVASALGAALVGAAFRPRHEGAHAAATLAGVVAFQALVTYFVPATAVPVVDPLLLYGVMFATTLAAVLALLRVVQSPFGRALVAIQDNPLLAEAIGYRAAWHRAVLQVLAASLACAAGALAALWPQASGTAANTSLQTLLCALLAVAIGGRSSVYGVVLGSVVLVLARQALVGVLTLATSAAEGWPLLAALVSPERCWLWLGVFGPAWVYHAPAGLVGLLGTDRRPSAPRQNTPGDPS